MAKMPPQYPPQAQPPPPGTYYQPQAPAPPPGAYYPPQPQPMAYYVPQPQPMGYQPTGEPAQGVAPFQVQGAPANPGHWTTGLCDCIDDPGNCCMTFFCPCITFGQIAEIVDRGTTSCGVSGALYGLICALTGCQCIYSCMYRTKIRAQYNLPDEPCNDCCVHCCCEYCAICQAYRELKNRGFDVNLGWHGNIERQAAMGTAVPPQVPGGMTR